ncbi:uncharacterized protein LOC120341207 [Styela clava]
MALKHGITKRKQSDEGTDQGASSSGGVGSQSSPKSGTISRKQKKVATKQKKISKQVAQEQVQNRIRNKLLIAVVLYIVIGGAAVYWFGLPKPKDLPPEVEADILGSYPHEIAKEDLPKGFYEEEPKRMGLSQDKKETSENGSEHEQEKEQTSQKGAKSDSEKPSNPDPVKNAAGGIGAEAVEMFPNFEEHVQTGFKLKAKDGQKWKKLKILKNNATSKVQIYIMDNFLSEFECNGLMRAHLRHLQAHEGHDPITCFSGIASLKQHLREHGLKKMAPKMTEYDFIPGTLCLNDSMSSKVGKNLPWSYSTSFYPGESKFSSVFDERVNKYAGLDPRNGGKFQVTSYPEGVGYKGHHDCTVDSPDKRDRFATILVYLQDVEDGGETEFPDLGVKVRPKKGRALLWNNMGSDGNCDLHSFHKAAMVTKGRKYILQRWYYYQNFPMLGKRTPQPSLPKRNEFTARVSCDQYQFGSCRWYDEWTYDHITSYSQVKHTLR